MPRRGSAGFEPGRSRGLASEKFAAYPLPMNGAHPNHGAQLLAATVAGRLIAVAAAEVLQILPMLPLWRPPTAPASLCGFAEAGGILPVLSARALLGLGAEATPALYAHIVRVGKVGCHQAGLLVDRAEGFVIPSALEPLAAGDTLNGCATALFTHGGAVGWVIDPARLLDAAEGEALAAFAAEARRRRTEWAVDA